MFLAVFLADGSEKLQQTKKKSHKNYCSLSHVYPWLKPIFISSYITFILMYYFECTRKFPMHTSKQIDSSAITSRHVHTIFFFVIYNGIGQSLHLRFRLDRKKQFSDHIRIGLYASAISFCLLQLNCINFVFKARN